jgi:lysophospholipase L1-like esterase
LALGGLACLTACTSPQSLGPRTAHDAVTAAQRGDYYAKRRHARILSDIQARGSSIKVVFLGDSITDFWRTTGKGIWKCYQAEPYEAADFGVAGDRTEHVLWRMANGEMARIHPKVIVLLIGTNNLSPLTADKPEWVASGVRKIVGNLHKTLPETKVLLLGVFPRSTSASQTRQRVRDLNRSLAAWHGGRGTRFLNLDRDFVRDDDEICRGVMYPDKLHLTRKGYEIWDKGMRPTLREMMHL